MEKRLEGKIERYSSEKGYGVLLGEDGEKYLFTHSDLPYLLGPLEGLEVSFSAIHYSHGLYAAALRLKNDADSQRAAQEALRLKRERDMAEDASRKRAAEAEREQKRLEGERLAREAEQERQRKQAGLARQDQKGPEQKGRERALQELEPGPPQLPPVEPPFELSPGLRVFFAPQGNGSVQSVKDNMVAVLFDASPIRPIQVPVNLLQKVHDPLANAGSAQPNLPGSSKPVAPGPIRPGGSQLASYLWAMRAEVLQTLAEEGVDAGEVYRYAEPQAQEQALRLLDLDERVATAFQTVSGIRAFYSHQAEARQALLRGRNVIIATPTASGKTEAYNPTILEHLLNHPKSTALYLFPLVALGVDQTERLQKLNQALPTSSQLEIGIYNGNVPDDVKKRTQHAQNRILVTTPESLHYIFLPNRKNNWGDFYRNLRYVVVDEAHVYKGVFGANMANILRRVLARCRREGNPSDPQLIISSATIRHPERLSEQLSGLPANTFEVITESGAPKPGKHFLVTRSDIHNIESICGDLLSVNADPVGGSAPRPLSIIVFMRSIASVKKVSRSIKNHLRETGRESLAALVDEYYSEKTNKGDSIARLRKGEVRCIFATTALMAGIDIGSLDVVIVQGFPRLVMDARQMFGRAGRAGEGAAIFIADRIDPFDQFYFEKPELLFSGPTENVVANPENPRILTAHLQCAAQSIPDNYQNVEGPLLAGAKELFGPMGNDLLESLVSTGRLSLRSGFYHLESLADPHKQPPLDSLRAMSSETYTLFNQKGYKLEEKREETAFRDAHQDAIIAIDGQNYKVTAFDLNSRRITCTPYSDRNESTRGLPEKVVTIKAKDEPKHNHFSGTLNGATMQAGDIKIVTSFKFYRLYRTVTLMQCRNHLCGFETKDLNTRRCPNCKSALHSKQKEEVIDEYPIPDPPKLQRKLETRAAWFEFYDEIQKKFSDEFWPRWQKNNHNDLTNEHEPVPDFEYAIHTIEHAILKAFPEYIPCDPDEVAAIFQFDKTRNLYQLFIYDNFPDGLGLVDEFRINLSLVLLSGALDVIERCTCVDDEGCPVCIKHYGCHNFNQGLSKLGGRFLLRSLLGLQTQAVLEDLSEYVQFRYPNP